MRYFLRTTKEEGFASLYVEVQKRTPKLKFKICTPIEVSIKEWHKAIASSANYSAYLRSHKSISETMDKVQSAIENALKMGITERKDIAQMIDAIVYRDARQAIQERNEQIMAEREKAENSPLKYILRIISEMKNGTRLSKGAKYKKNTIHSLEGLYNHLQRFVGNGSLDWEDINRRKIDLFVNNLTEYGLMPSSINTYIRTFRLVFNFALADELHTNEKGAKCFVQICVADDETKTEIYLTQDELNALYKFPLLGTDASIRDAFLVGCYTCQRFGDYTNIGKGDFTTTPNGTKVLKLVQQKTGTKVTIPILSDNLFAIMEKYNYNLPKFSNATFNERLKFILQNVANVVPSLKKMEKAKLTKREANMEKQGKAEFQRDENGNVVRPRYELVCTHTARRSGITNLYLSGKFDIVSMMKISGHKSEDTFMRYIRVTDEEHAERIADTYFSETRTKAETL